MKRQEWLEKIKESQKRPYKIPQEMLDETQYSDTIKEARHLLPGPRLTKLAFKNLVDQYKTQCKRGTLRTRLLAFSYISVKKGAVIYQEFAYHIEVKNFKENIFSHYGNQFVFTEGFDFKTGYALTNEKKDTTYMGTQYKVKNESFVYQYQRTTNKGNPIRRLIGRFWGETLYHESFCKLKINDYFYFDAFHHITNIWTEGFHWGCLHNYQKLLEHKPEITEMLFKTGYKKLLHHRISEAKCEFLKNNTSWISKTVEKAELDLLYSIHKIGKSPQKYIEKIKETFGLYHFEDKSEVNHRNNYDKYEYDLEYMAKHGRTYGQWRGVKYRSYSSTNIKALFRVMSLLDNGYSWGEFNHFAGCCHALKLNQNKMIFKGEKERKKIIALYDERLILAHRHYENLLKEQKVAQKERAKKERISKERALSELGEITKIYKEFNKNGFFFFPIRTVNDFYDMAETFNNCLTRNDYMIDVGQQKKVLYVAVPEGQKITDGEIISWRISTNNLQLEQIHGHSNKSTPYYDKIKETAIQLKYEDLIQKGEK